MLTEIMLVLLVDGARRPSDGDRGRRVRQCCKGRVSRRTSLFDGTGVVVGKRHWIRFRAGRRLLSPQIIENSCLNSSNQFRMESFAFYLETGIGSIPALTEFHGRASRFSIWSFNAFARTAFSGRDQFHQIFIRTPPWTSCKKNSTTKSIRTSVY
jgi:hypothetical protein